MHLLDCEGKIMNKFSFSYGQEAYLFGMNRIKYVVSHDANKTHRFMNLLRFIFNRLPSSEFQESNGISINAYFNDYIINVKEWDYFEVSSTYDMHSDFRLPTSSLLFKCLDALCEDIELLDELNTINILMNDVATALTDKAEEEGLPLLIRNQDINKKQLLKLLEVILWNQEEYTFPIDMLYCDYIILQLKMAQALAKCKPDNKVLVFLDFTDYDEKISEYLKSIKEKNIHIVAYCGQVYSSCEDIHDVLFFKDKTVDFADEEKLYEEILNLYDGYIEYDELVEELFNIIKGKNSDRIDKVLSLL